MNFFNVYNYNFYWICKFLSHYFLLHFDCCLAKYYLTWIFDMWSTYFEILEFNQKTFEKYFLLSIRLEQLLCYFFRIQIPLFQVHPVIFYIWWSINCLLSKTACSIYCINFLWWYQKSFSTLSSFPLRF